MSKKTERKLDRVADGINAAGVVICDIKTLLDLTAAWFNANCSQSMAMDGTWLYYEQQTRRHLAEARARAPDRSAG